MGNFTVRLSHDLRALLDRLPARDLDTLEGELAGPLEELGFEFIEFLVRGSSPGITVEWLEPAEEAMHVWARVFIDLSIGAVPLKIERLSDGSLGLSTFAGSPA